jgi:glycosyltransferase involved in cell wall biosynthesis
VTLVPRFSLIIPARNEESYLPRLLDTVDAARARFRGGPDGVEVIVADNVSTDRTVEIARRRDCRVITVEKRVIGAVRNGGARAARGEILAFVDADARIHPETFNAIDALMAGGRVVAGATGVRLERMSLGIALTLAFFLPLVWITGLDTGVTFCRKDDFEAVRGYNEERKFAEDVQFLFDLKRLGRRRGQRLGRARSAKALASVRKFDRYGDWHYFVLIARGLWTMASRPHALERWISEYWYSDRR